MLKSVRLDNRIKLCAKMVRRGSRLADIGTDHAYLPAYLCASGKCPSAIAADINPGPLESAKRTIAEAGLQDKIEARLSNGLEKISGDEVDDIVIAGMGGELIARIIGDWSASRSSEKRFVLQPMTKSEYLIFWLRSNGFRLEAQDCCEAGSKLYTVLSARYDGSIGCDSLYPYLGDLKPKEDPLHLRFIEAELERLKKQAVGDSRYGLTAERLGEYLYDNY